MSQVVADLGTSVSWGLCAKLWSARQPRDGPSGTWVLPCGGPPGAFFIVPLSSRAAGMQVPHRAWPCGDDLPTEEGGLKTFTPCRRQHAEHRGGRGVGGGGRAAALGRAGLASLRRRSVSAGTRCRQRGVGRCGIAARPEAHGLARAVKRRGPHAARRPCPQACPRLCGIQFVPSQVSQAAAEATSGPQVCSSSERPRLGGCRLAGSVVRAEPGLSPRAPHPPGASAGHARSL